MIDFQIDPEALARAKAELGLTEEDEPEPETAPVVQTQVVTNTTRIQQKRGRGRPKGSRNKATILREQRQQMQSAMDIEPDVEVAKEAPADLLPKLTKRDEREVAQRLQNILMGATGIGGIVKPYIPMTEEEANAVAVPLASYLVRNADVSPIAREILENYDLVAITLGMASYSVRVYNDRREELATQRPRNVTTLQRVSEREVRMDGRGPDEGTDGKLSVAPIAGSQPYTPQL